MPVSPYNSTLSMAARAVLILAARPGMARNERSIAAVDMLVTHARDFGLYPVNLHGNTNYAAAGMAARVQAMHAGIIHAVLHGFITAEATPEGLKYTVTDVGEALQARISSQYQRDYETALIPVLAFVDSHTASEVLERIETLPATIKQKDQP